MRSSVLAVPGITEPRAIRENDPDGTIAVYSEHGYSPYNPMLTTYYVAGRDPL